MITIVNVYRSPRIWVVEEITIPFHLIDEKKPIIMEWLHEHFRDRIRGGDKYAHPPNMFYIKKLTK